MTAKARQWFYLISGLIAAMVPILIQIGVIGSEKGETSLTLIETIGSLLGAGAATTAGVIVAKQRKGEGLEDLVLDATVNQTPLDMVVNNIPIVMEQAAQAEANVAKMREVTAAAVGGVLNATPIAGTSVGPMTQQALDAILNPVGAHRR